LAEAWKKEGEKEKKKKKKTLAGPLGFLVGQPPRGLAPKIH
jgi:hypothetical protein